MPQDSRSWFVWDPITVRLPPPNPTFSFFVGWSWIVLTRDVTTLVAFGVPSAPKEDMLGQVAVPHSVPHTYSSVLTIHCLLQVGRQHGMVRDPPHSSHSPPGGLCVHLWPNGHSRNSAVRRERTRGSSRPDATCTAFTTRAHIRGGTERSPFQHKRLASPPPPPAESCLPSGRF